MNSLCMRIRMRRCLRKLSKLWIDNNDTVAGNATLEFTNTKAKLEVLKALQSIDCVILSCPDNSNRPYVIRAGENSSIYFLERFELWLNRIVSFIAGILTTVAAHYIIQLLTLLLEKE